MPVSHSDRYVLSQYANFRNRVRMALVRAAALVVSTETEATPNYHRRRPYAIAVLNGPDNFSPVYASAITANVALMDAATANGTIVLDATNIEARQAAVTDAQLNTAINEGIDIFAKQG
jgi:hypothetical protein